jgi:hypothetical protein
VWGILGVAGIEVCLSRVLNPAPLRVRSLFELVATLEPLERLPLLGVTLSSVGEPV